MSREQVELLDHNSNTTQRPCIFMGILAFTSVPTGMASHADSSAVASASLRHPCDTLHCECCRLPSVIDQSICFSFKTDDILSMVFLMPMTRRELKCHEELQAESIATCHLQLLFLQQSAAFDWESGIDNFLFQKSLLELWFHSEFGTIQLSKQVASSENSSVVYQGCITDEDQGYITDETAIDRENIMVDVPHGMKLDSTVKDIFHIME
ncbi:unnamed protein product [Darwinula stevensoni]|uniref:Uncharacterized protein n=1 Tax=Darwinula stevensoni TaxID=69355 RepID=A0A7R9AA56_9CRUS|nr:unnamed protein product [Darwinula stevensoni]CAG0898101.1 unnamed protein product [Darwinula stevensoni]